MRSTISKKISIAAAAVLAASGAVVFAVPSQAASVPINYTCTLPVFGAKTFAVVFDTDAPATLPANTASAPLNSTGSLTIPADIVNTIRDTLAATRMDGSVKTLATTVAGAPKESANIPIPAVAVPATLDSPMTMNLAGPLGFAVPASPGPTTQTILAGAFTSHLNFYKVDGTAIGTGFDVPCVPAADQNLLVDSVAIAAPTTPTPVAKANTTTKARATYARAHDKATVRVAVTAATGSATGKVAVTLKKGTKKIKTITVNLAAGKAKAVFKKVSARGTYKVTASYAGSTTTKASSGKTTFKVS
jgi:Family of unknown function (DUF6801)/Bacterial Ig-like domain (group 3)